MKTLAYIVAMYALTPSGDYIKAVGEIHPEKHEVTAYILPEGEKCEGFITYKGDVVCNTSKEAFYFKISPHLPSPNDG